jgi:hypothetical protein
MARKIPAYKIQRSEPVAAPEVIQGDHPRGEALANIPKHEVVDGARVVQPSDRIHTTMEIRSQIANIMNTRNYHPIREMVEMVQKKGDDGKYLYDAAFRLEIHRELAPYIAPKLKAAELTVTNNGTTFNISVKKFIKGDSPELSARKVRAEPIMDVKAEERK